MGDYFSRFLDNNTLQLVVHQMDKGLEKKENGVQRTERNTRPPIPSWAQGGLSPPPGEEKTITM